MNLYSPKIGTTPLQEFAKDAALMLSEIFTASSGQELSATEQNTLNDLLETFFRSIDKRMEL